MKKTQNDILFSIVVPVYNRERYMNRCIDSIINQSFQDWEAVIVDDGSTDDTAQKVKSYGDDRIRYLFKENGGVSSARNHGIDNARGTYIAFLDSDDEFRHDHLQNMHDFLKQKEFPVCLICSDHLFNFNGRIVKGDNSGFMNSKPDFTHLPYIVSTAIHRDALKGERFVEWLKFREDNEFLDRIRFKVPSFRVKQRSVMIHRHDGNVTGDAFLMKKEAEKSIKYYMRTRKKITKKEWTDLFDIYSYLTMHYFRERNTIMFTQYLFKMILSSPICLFHYPSLKKTVNRFKSLLWKKPT